MIKSYFGGAKCTMCWCNVCLWILVTEGIQLSEDVIMKSFTCRWKEVCGHVIEEPLPPPTRHRSCRYAERWLLHTSLVSYGFSAVCAFQVVDRQVRIERTLSALFLCVSDVFHVGFALAPFNCSHLLVFAGGDLIVCFLLFFLIICICLDEDHFLTIALLISVLFFDKYPSTQ